MGVKFNPIGFSGLDFVGSGGSSPSGPAVRHVQSFSTLDWALASPYYELTVSAGTHGKGVNPSVNVYELVDGDYEQVGLVIKISPLGDVVLQITASPDTRFNGVVVIL